MRFQAPEEPGTYSAVYTIGDDFEQTARANVTFTVVAKDAGENRAAAADAVDLAHVRGLGRLDRHPARRPRPRRRLRGAHRHLVGAQPRPRRRAHEHVDHATRRSRVRRAPTRSRYELRDAFGATAKGTIRIGVIPRPAVALPPKAVDDAIEVKPGRTASVEVLAQRLRSERLQPEGRRPARGRRGHRGRDPRQATGRRRRRPTRRARSRSATRSRTDTAAPTPRSSRSR